MDWWQAGSVTGTIVLAIASVATLGWRVLRREFDAVGQRFEGVARQFEGMERRFDAVERRFDAVGQQFDALQSLQEDFRAHVIRGNQH